MTLWAVACQAPLFMGFPRQEYCRGLPFSSPGDLPDPGNEPGSPALQSDSLLSEPPGKLQAMFNLLLWVMVTYVHIIITKNMLVLGFLW